MGQLATTPSRHACRAEAVRVHMQGSLVDSRIRLAARPSSRLAISGDAAGLAAVGAAALISFLVLVRDGMLISLDSSTQYIPWYAYLGESLRAGRVPGWNPANFGGTPFAADPLSGWTYLPAMLLFAALPLDLAWRAILVFHPLLAGVSAYALARTLGLVTPGAALAGVAYACSPFLQMHTSAAQPFAAVAAWLPLALVGIERAVRCQHSSLQRIGWWSVAGLAVSQTIAVWPGQGSAYAALAVAGYGLVAGVATAGCRSLASRLAWLGGHVTLPLLLGGLLAAAGLLPRLEFLALSNLASGYPPEARVVGGWRIDDWWRVMAPGYWGAGIITLVLAIAGLIRLPGRSVSTPAVRAGAYLIAVSLGALVLTSSVSTPLHTVLYALPGVERLHAHIPERILVVAYLGPALFAGLAFDALSMRIGAARAAGVGLAIFGALLLEVNASADRLVGATWDSLHRVSAPAAYYASPPAAAFLGERRRQEGPFRFVGFGPETHDGNRVPYTQRFAAERARSLLVNNRSVTLGLEDVQGYSAIHLARFDAFLLEVNGGRAQNYHDGYVLEPGLASPLLDLMGVRYLVAPHGVVELGPTVFVDGEVSVIRRDTALPRAWVVHEAEVAQPAEALQRLARREVDPRRVALIEQPLEHMLPGGPGSSAEVLSAESEMVRARVQLDRPGLAVFSEVYYPGWSAYVDGQRASLVAVDGLLRGVLVAAGDHIIELRFESATLALGVAISAIMAIVLGCVGGVGVWRGRLA